MRLIAAVVDEIHYIQCTLLFVKALRANHLLTCCHRKTWYTATVAVNAKSTELVVKYEGDPNEYPTVFLGTSLLCHTDSTETLRWRVKPSVGANGEGVLSGVLASPDILRWAGGLDPVDCCRFLGVRLANKKVPSNLLSSEDTRNVLADAALLRELCTMSETGTSIFCTGPLYALRRKDGECTVRFASCFEVCAHACRRAGDLSELMCLPVSRERDAKEAARKKQLLELSLEQLRQRAGARGLVRSGNKSDLAVRLIKHEDMLNKVEVSFHGIEGELTDRSKIAAAAKRSHASFISRALYENV